ncbi:MAG: AcrR family transcriptional regulator [Paracoccaceae bacterium]|jgi:AcrR family transcriptional regulator
MDGSEQDQPRGWRGSADAWIDAAYAVLIDQGVDAVKVMTLAKALNLSRTSFYWHFADRDALLAALLARWEGVNTGNLIARADAYAATITEAMFNLFDCWITPDLFDARFDFAVRTWARGDDALTATLARSDAARLAAIDAMFRRYGYPAAEADTRARTIYLTQVGYISMMTEEDRALRLSRMPPYAEVFTGRPAAPEEVARFMARHGAAAR